MSREFDLHLSEDFKGGVHFSSFTAATYEEFMEALSEHWHRAGITPETGEMFIFTTIDTAEGDYEFELGYYRVDEDGVTGMLTCPETGSIEHIICTLLGVDVDAIGGDDQDLFQAVARSIVTYDKRWRDLSPAEVAKVDELLATRKRLLDERDAEALRSFGQAIERLFASTPSLKERQDEILRLVETYSRPGPRYGDKTREGVRLEFIPEAYLNDRIITYACMANIDNIDAIPDRFARLELYQQIWGKLKNKAVAKEAFALIPDFYKPDL